jgi:uncharacterized protein (DUF362 family)
MSEDPIAPQVAVVHADTVYPVEAPYHPSEQYPEYTGPVGREPNRVYELVRECFRLLGYDGPRFGTPQWNPLGHLIKPGDRVFLKPNFVAHEYRKSCGHDGDLFSVITHPSVIRAIADYAAIALEGRGEIVIGDNPSIDADFTKILAATNIGLFPNLYRDQFGVSCRILDLRHRRTDNLEYYGFQTKTVPQTGDPEGSMVLNLGKHSYFFGMNSLLFRGVFNNRWETIRHHHGATQEYSISATIARSDVYISIPKMKAHHKVGATLNVKGLVGINDNKNYMVHWRVGFPKLGGDEYPEAHRLRDYAVLALQQLFLDVLPERWYLFLRKKIKPTAMARKFQIKRVSSHEQFRGAWDGNDTTWRMAADLYNLFIADCIQWRAKRQKTVKTFSLVDGIVGGEGNGPFTPTAKKSGILIAGENLLAVDCVAVRVMDYRWQEIRYLRSLCRQHSLEPDGIRIYSNQWPAENFFDPGCRYANYIPPHGWTHLSVHQREEAVYENHHPCCG